MKKWLVLLSVLCIMMSSVLTGCGSPGPAESSSTETKQSAEEAPAFDMEPTVWTMVDYTDASSKHYKQHADMVKAIYERTGGLLDIQQHSISEFPFSGTDMLSVTADRTVEMTIPSLSYIEGESVISSIVEWPMLVTNNEEMQTAFNVLEPYLKAEFDAKGVEMLGWWSTMGLGFYGVGDTPHKLADLGNRKIRLYSAPITKVLTNYNVVPVSMTVSEVIPALQRKVVDAALTGCLYAYDMKWYEIVDWAYIMNIAGAANGIFVNKEAMNELPEEVQAIVREEVANYHAANIEYNETETQKCIDGMAEKGVDVVYCSDEDYAEAAKFAEKVWNDLAAKAGPTCQEALTAVREALGK